MPSVRIRAGAPGKSGVLPQPAYLYSRAQDTIDVALSDVT